MTTTFSTTLLDSGLTLSNGNLTVTGASGNKQILGSSFHDTGKYYFEYQSVSHVGSLAIGVGGTNFFPGSNSSSGCVIDGSGNMTNDYGDTVGLGGAPDGHVVGIAVDFDNNRIWFRYDTGNWNNSGTANPATNTGGKLLNKRTALTPLVFLQNGGSVTLALASGSWTNSAPSGFSAWDSTSETNCLVTGMMQDFISSGTTVSNRGFVSGDVGDVIGVAFMAQPNSTASPFQASAVSVAGRSATFAFRKQWTAGGTNATIEVWWLKITSTPVLGGQVSFTFPSPGNDAGVVMPFTVRNLQDPTNPFDQASPFSSQNPGSSATPSVSISTDGKTQVLTFLGIPGSTPSPGTVGTATGDCMPILQRNFSTSNTADFWGCIQRPAVTTSQTSHAQAFANSISDWAMLSFGFAGPGNTGAGVTGTWASTEATDRLSFLGINPPSGVLSATEAPDTWSTSSGFTRFEVYDEFVGTGSTVLSTEYPDTVVLCYVGLGAVVTVPGNVTVASDNLVWNRRVRFQQGPGQVNENNVLECWWAYAHDKLVSETVHVTSDNGNTTVGEVLFLKVKGLNGNYLNPFDVLPEAHGGNSGAFVGSNTTPQTLTPYETGPQDLATGFWTFFGSVIGNVSLTVHDLTATSTGSPSNLNWAVGNSTDQLGSGAVYFEMHCTTVGTGGSFPGDFGLGVLGAYALDPSMAEVQGGAILTSSGAISAGLVGAFSQLGSLDVAIVAGDYIAVAADLDNDLIWFKNLTHGNHFWNGSAQADPNLRTGGISYTAGGVGIHWFNEESVHVGADTVKLGSNLPIASVAGGGGAVTANFGGSTFQGTVPAGFTQGWPSRVQQIGATHQVWPHITLIATQATRTSGYDDVSGFSGFNSITDNETGSQRSQSLTVSWKYGDQNVLYGDDVLFSITPKTARQWLLAYDTLVPGVIDPGSWESTEAKDHFSAVGFGPGGSGVIGFLHGVETPDIFAATGFVAIVGAWLSTEAKDTFSAFISVPITATWASVEAPDVFHAVGIGQGEDGVWISTETPDMFAAVGIVPSVGTMNATENADRFRAIGAGVVQTKRRRIFFVT